MAKIINLTNKLRNAPSFIILGEGKQYKVNDGYKAVMEASALFDTGDMKKIMKGFEIFLGKEARAEIEEMSLADIRVVMDGISAAISGETYEEHVAEEAARFQDGEDSAK